MFMILIVSSILSLVLILLNSFISFKKNFSREKSSAFECGYDPKSESRLPFSIQFFLVSIIFLIFDVEITLIIPMPLILKFLSSNMWISLTLFFIVILVVGTIHEWNEGSLDWTK